MDIEDHRQRYLKWWKGKLCRPFGSTGPFRRVTGVLMHGPPSFVYGCAELLYEDGIAENIYHGDAFKPRKMDVEVKDG